MLPLLLTLTASGRDHPAALLPAADENEDGLILVAGEALSAPPVALVSGQPLVLRDDGKAPDVLAEDGVFSGRMPLAATMDHRDLTVTLQDRAGAVLWEDAIPAGDSQYRPLIKALVSGQYAVVQVSFQDRKFDGEARQPTRKPPSRTAPYTLSAPYTAPTPYSLSASYTPSARHNPSALHTPSAPRPPAAPSASSAPPAPPAPATGFLTAGLVGVIALVAGGLIGMWTQRRRQRAVPLSPVRPPSGIARTPEVWQLPASVVLSDVVASLATAWIEAGPVLLVPQAASRPVLALQGRTGMAWMATERPQTRHIVQAVSGLSVLGTPAVVIEGLDALEEPVEDEPPDALLDELHQSISGRVVVLVHEGTPLRAPPTCTFSLVEGNLDSTAGRLTRGESGWHWQPASSPTAA
ncbi:MAG: hypothetical protein P8R54_21955 [Myxococcota bacterium]|nr:hypothetical protein [Myxococcota bacterium]